MPAATHEQDKALDVLTQNPRFGGMYKAKPVERGRLLVTAAWSADTHFNTFTALLLPNGAFIQRRLVNTDHNEEFKGVAHV